MSDLANKLETIIDRASVEAVLLALAEVCEAKSGHVAENWQDEALSRRWDAAYTAVSAAAHKCANLDYEMISASPSR